MKYTYFCVGSGYLAMVAILNQADSKSYSVWNIHPIIRPVIERTFLFYFDTFNPEYLFPQNMLHLYIFKN